MKITIKLLILAFLLMPIKLMHGQKIKKKNVKFKFTRLPLKPLLNLDNSSFTVSTPYPKNNDDIINFAKTKHKQDLDNYPETVKNSELKFEETLKEYETDVKKTRENFKLESDEFKSMSLVERLALKDTKPRLRLPTKPRYYKPRPPIYRSPDLSQSIVFNPDVLSQTYLNIDGITKVKDSENSLIGVISFYNFEYSEPTRKIETETYYNSSSKTRENRNVNYYIYKYHRPTHLKLMYKGKVLYDGIFMNTGQDTSIKIKNRYNQIHFEKKSIKDNLISINNYINNYHGFTQVNTTTLVKYVKNKKEKYDDVEDAYNNATSGYEKMSFNSSNTELKEAVTIWKSVLEESDVSDKKARVNIKVTKALLYNLMEANLYLGNIEEVQKYMDEFKKLKLRYNDKSYLDSLKPKIEDFDKRIKANK